ncbi:MAG: hypothetical protein WCG05_03785 [Alphaproteobacteria bacterium]
MKIFIKLALFTPFLFQIAHSAGQSAEEAAQQAPQQALSLREIVARNRASRANSPDFSTWTREDFLRNPQYIDYYFRTNRVTAEEERLRAPNGPYRGHYHHDALVLFVEPFTQAPEGFTLYNQTLTQYQDSIREAFLPFRLEIPQQDIQPFFQALSILMAPDYFFSRPDPETRMGRQYMEILIRIPAAHRSTVATYIQNLNKNPQPTVFTHSNMLDQYRVRMAMTLCIPNTRDLHHDASPEQLFAEIKSVYTAAMSLILFPTATDGYCDEKSMDGYIRRKLVTFLWEIPMAERDSIAPIAAQLAPLQRISSGHQSLEDRICIINSLKTIPLEQRLSLLPLVQSFTSRIPIMNSFGGCVAALIDRLAQVDPVERQDLVSLFVELLPFNRLEAWCPANIIKILNETNHEHRRELLNLSREMVELFAPSPTYSIYFSHIVNALAVSPEERQSITSCLRRLHRPPLGLEVIRTVASISMEERGPIVGQVAVLLDREILENLEFPWNSEALRVLSSATRQARTQAALERRQAEIREAEAERERERVREQAALERRQAEIRTRAPQAQPRQQVDLENVMNARRIAASAVALKCLWDITPGFQLDPEIVTIVGDYIASITDPIFQKIRAGDTELNHALFVLSGHKNEARGDSDSLADNEIYTSGTSTYFRMLGILGRVWHIIHSPEMAAHKDKLLHSFVTALTQCFDEEGYRGPHRICNVGKVQRLLSVLQGYVDGIRIDEVEEIPTVEKVLVELTSSLFNEGVPKVTVSEAQALIAETAARVYGNDPVQAAWFQEYAKEFLELIRDSDRSLIAEQDAAYFASLAADQAHAEALRLQQEAQEREETLRLQQEAEEAAHLAARAAETREQRAARLAAAAARRQQQEHPGAASAD